MNKKPYVKCRDCSEPAEVGHTRCLKHLASHNNGTKIAKKRNAEKGLCRCGKETLPFQSRCSACKESHNSNAKRRAKYRKEKGLCVDCGKPLDLCSREDRVRCWNCSSSEFSLRW